MSETKLTKNEKITAIMTILGVHDEHHDHIREHLELLSCDIIRRQYDHCLVVKEYKESQEEETLADE